MSFARLAVMLAALTGLFLAVGFAVGGQAGMVIALVLAGAMNAFAFWNADSLVLRMHNAQEVDARTAPDLHALVADLARRADLPMPRVYVIDTPQPNAFATGRSPQRAAVAATTGLMGSLSREELAGVMAHELAHVRNRDTLTMTVTATLAGAISMLANMALFFGPSSDEEGGGSGALGMVGGLLLAILAPLAAMLVQMAISRGAEYRADQGGAEICGNPLWLAGALDKLERGGRGVPNPSAERNPASAPLFIVNPLRGRRLDALFSTHPTTASRIARLREMAGTGVGPGGGAGGGSGVGAGAGAGAGRGPWG